MILFRPADNDMEYKTIEEHSFDGFDFVIVEHLEVISFQNKQAKTLTKFSDFKQSHQFYIDSGVPIGMTAINAYIKNKDSTAKLFAKTPFEKKFYGRLTADLLATGKYKLVSKQYTNGGVMIELKREG